VRRINVWKLPPFRGRASIGFDDQTVNYRAYDCRRDGDPRRPVATVMPSEEPIVI
jgi:hypothetical protein